MKKKLLLILSHVLVGILCICLTLVILNAIDGAKTSTPTIKMTRLDDLRGFYERQQYSPTNYAREDMNVGKVPDEETAIANAKKLFKAHLKFVSSDLDEYEYQAYFDVEKGCWLIKGEFPKKMNTVTLGMIPYAVITPDGQVLGLWED